MTDQEDKNPNTVIARNVESSSHSSESGDLKPQSTKDPQSSLGCVRDDLPSCDPACGQSGGVGDRHTPLLLWANELRESRLREMEDQKAKRWSTKNCAEKADLIHKVKPWQRSTGPKTPVGKARIANNAYQHGIYSQDMRAILQLLKMQKAYVKKVSADIHENIRHIRQDYATKSLMTQTIQSMITDLKHDFDRAGLAHQVHEIKMIVSHVTALSAEDFITKPDTPLTPTQQQEIQNIAKRVIAGEPLTRVLGVREFWGLEFKVTSAVLDPRADTETLIEAVLKWVNTNPVIARREAARQLIQNPRQNELPLKILDLGTGTGCIPIALLSELPNATAVAVDKCPKALKVARHNAEVHGMSERIEFIQGDWFVGVEGMDFDLIVSNPPYIADAVIPNLDENVKNHDPILALSGGESGLDCYKIIVAGLQKYLNGHNCAFLEIGFDQLESMARLVDESNLSLVASYQDLGGNPRVVEISQVLRGDK